MPPQCSLTGELRGAPRALKLDPLVTTPRVQRQRVRLLEGAWTNLTLVGPLFAVHTQVAPVVPREGELLAALLAFKALGGRVRC